MILRDILTMHGKSAKLHPAVKGPQFAIGARTLYSSTRIASAQTGCQVGDAYLTSHVSQVYVLGVWL